LDAVIHRSLEWIAIVGFLADAVVLSCLLTETFLQLLVARPKAMIVPKTVRAGKAPNVKL